MEATGKPKKKKEKKKKDKIEPGVMVPTMGGAGPGVPAMKPKAKRGPAGKPAQGTPSTSAVPPKKTSRAKKKNAVTAGPGGAGTALCFLSFSFP